ncbi:MAG: flagellar hook capping FlgD N-terminal domain-containing protein [Armatimonadia bacterium]
MNISAVSSSTSASSTTASNSLGPDAFMRLLIAELQNQDPLSPMDTQAMLTQLSTMELVSESRAARQSQDMVQAMGMMGRTVAWQDSDTGDVYSGTVEAVVRDGSDPVLMVGGVQLTLEEIIAVS